MQFESTPCFEKPFAKFFEKLISAAFDAEYAGEVGIGLAATRDAMWTSRPHPCSFMNGTHASESRTAS